MTSLFWHVVTKVQAIIAWLRGARGAARVLWRWMANHPNATDIEHAKFDLARPHSRAELHRLPAREQCEKSQGDFRCKLPKGHGGPHHAMKRTEGRTPAPAEPTDTERQLIAQRDAWREYALHQEWCRYCGEDGVKQCDTGRPLMEAAVASMADDDESPTPAHRVDGSDA